MKFMITLEGCGKTTKAMADALTYAKRYPTVFVTYGEKEAQRLRILYRQEMIGGKLEILYFRQLLMNPKKRFKRMVLDNIDMMLVDLLYHHIDTRGEERGYMALCTATGIPIRDLYTTREGAAMLWDIAAQQVKTNVDREKLIADFEQRAAELRKQIPPWYHVVEEREGQKLKAVE